MQREDCSIVFSPARKVTLLQLGKRLEEEIGMCVENYSAKNTKFCRKELVGS